jgi:hypothetical protein
MGKQTNTEFWLKTPYKKRLLEYTFKYNIKMEFGRIGLQGHELD